MIDLENLIYGKSIAMLNNYVLRRIRYILDLSDNQMVEIMQLSGLTVTKAEIVSWLKKDDSPNIGSVMIKPWFTSLTV